ncbi:transmembrane protein [Haloferax elongans ATCC BAA-1513]|uniref:Transmembrane protein n=1 Tax=Haloferax elongans ATCC BAA-1513 TaxID=1230453 RepID=M0HXT0_HALEO|nr:hypothetical protein [Haloferax elongans]ELZ88508.1 transmembrane protein [Haloferax elongans ATCC BAA-1513]
MRLNRWVTAGIAGSIGITAANLVSQALFFQLGNEILFHSEQQSDKLIAVMTQMEPLPVMETNPGVYMTISLFIGAFHGGIFAYIRDSLPENTIKSGLAYGGILWVLMALYFEFHAPFNMFGEPLPLLGLELVFWVIVVSVEGVIISTLYDRFGNSGLFY